MNPQLERLKVLLSLAAQPDPEPNTEPCQDDFAAFLDGRLQGRKRRTVLRYLRTHPQAYRDWQDMADVLLQAPPPPSEPEKVGKPVWLKNFTRWLHGVDLLFPRNEMGTRVETHGGLMGMAPRWAYAATFLLLVLLVPWMLVPPSSPNAYQTAIAILENRSDLRQRLQNHQWRWQKAPESRNSFSKDESILMAQKAFGAGLWSGQQTLLGESAAEYPASVQARPDKSWPETEQRAYFELGRLIVLWWTVQDMPAEFWQQQQTELEALRRDLPQPSALMGLEQGLQILSDNLDKQDYAALQENLLKFMQAYAPAAREGLVL